MSKSSCYRSFCDGESLRLSRPLRQGRYKLEEQEMRFLEFQRTLYMVRDFVSGRCRCHWLGRCMSSDKHTWLKKLPQEIALELGYNLLPGLFALKKEGVPSVDTCYLALRADCLELLGRLEQIRCVIKKDVSIEYWHMKKGGSLLEPLIEEAICLTRKAIAVM